MGGEGRVENGREGERMGGKGREWEERGDNAYPRTTAMTVVYNDVNKVPCDLNLRA